MQFLLVHSMMICSRDLQSQWSKCSNARHCLTQSFTVKSCQITLRTMALSTFVGFGKSCAFRMGFFVTRFDSRFVLYLYLCADPNFQVAPYRAVNIKIPQNPQSFPSSLRGQSRLEAHASTSRQHLKNPSLQSKANTPSLWTKTAKIQHLIVLKF